MINIEHGICMIFLTPAIIYFCTIKSNQQRYIHAAVQILPLGIIKKTSSWFSAMYHMHIILIQLIINY